MCIVTESFFSVSCSPYSYAEDGICLKHLVRNPKWWKDLPYKYATVTRLCSIICAFLIYRKLCVFLLTWHDWLDFCSVKRRTNLMTYRRHTHLITLGYMKLIDEARDTKGAQGVSVDAAQCRWGWGESNFQKLKKSKKKKNQELI